MTADERNRYAAEYTRINRKLEKIWFPKVLKALKSKISSLIGKIKEDGLQAGLRYLHTNIGNYPLRQVIEDMYSSVGVIHARKADVRLKKEIGKSNHGPVEMKRVGSAQTWIDFIQNYLKQFLIEKITFTVNETTRDKLLSVMNEAIEMGWGVDETVKHLEDLSFTPYQAARIVRTEINRAANVGVHAQGTSFEYELQKIWISVKDNRTRGRKPHDHADHYHLDGQVVDFDGLFVDPKNGHELIHPGDPKAEAEDVVNCRCNFSTQAKRNERGRLIPKTNMSRQAA